MSQARCVLVTLNKFSLLFGVAGAENFLSITDTLSKTVQKKSHLCASQVRKMAEVTISNLKDQRSDACFNKFWNETKPKASVDKPVLPQKRGAPLHFDEIESNIHHHEIVENLYRKYYFEILDILIGKIERRFESPTFTLFSKVEEVLQNAATEVNVPCTDAKDIVDHLVKTFRMLTCVLN